MIPHILTPMEAWRNDVLQSLSTSQDLRGRMIAERHAAGFDLRVRRRRAGDHELRPDGRTVRVTPAERTNENVRYLVNFVANALGLDRPFPE